jgi:meiotically up-regulated gene 157 (Mug157) protein
MLIRGTLAGGVLALRSSRLWTAEKGRTPCRPPPEKRALRSPAVEANLRRIKGSIADPELAWLFENCYPNTLDTTVTVGERDGKPDTFVVTGDIAAMWLRDSSAQVWPYLALARSDDTLQGMFRGLIHRQARCILIDPYANAFLPDPQATQPLKWAVQDKTDMKPGVAERKWEVDSLCYPIRLAQGYWEATQDRAPFDDEWRSAMTLVVRTFREQQRREGPGPYRFQREAETPTETLAGDGYGVPTRKVGLIHSMFRPSDDACTYPYLVPSNAFALHSLRQLAQLSRALHDDETFAMECEQLAGEIEVALDTYGRVRDEHGKDFWAYEADGYGN